MIELLSERPGAFAFNGLRRTLNVHPESLVRALRRLERDGAIVRAEGGYALKEPTEVRSIPPRPRVRALASVRIPSGPTRAEFLGRMAGRWIGPLRWLGYYERPEDPWLVWSVGTGPDHVMLSLHRGTLRVLTDEAVERSVTERAAYGLLARALEELSGERSPVLPGSALAFSRSFDDASVN